MDILLQERPASRDPKAAFDVFRRQYPRDQIILEANDHHTWISNEDGEAVRVEMWSWDNWTNLERLMGILKVHPDPYLYAPYNATAIR